MNATRAYVEGRLRPEDSVRGAIVDCAGARGANG